MRRNILAEATGYMDPDKKYPYYGTGDVDGKDIFADRTGTSYYDDLFRNPDYAQKQKNLDLEVQMMTPAEYYAICAESVFDNATVDGLKAQRKKDVRANNDIKEIVTKYHKRLFMPYINLANHQQEGLHRMMLAGELFGWDTEFPVLVIDWHDYERHEEEERSQKLFKYKRCISDSVRESMRYEYPQNKFKEYFYDQICFEIDKQYKLDDEDKDLAKDNLTVEINGDKVEITTYQFTDIEKLSDFHISQRSTEDDEDDDFDFDVDKELEDFEISDFLFKE